MPTPKPIPIDQINKTVFWGNVAIKTESECWLWKRTTANQGYGNFNIGRNVTKRSRAYLAHRVAWALHNQKSPSKLLLHKCDTPACCNPSHLFEGDQADNSKDKCAKGRQNRGSLHRSSKLTEDKVLELRKEHKAGATAKSLAFKNGVTAGQISSILNGRYWKHVSMP